MSQNETIYVIGHRNPDTDSICSAIAYADLCHLQGRTNVIPGRAGSLNKQTEFILDSLGVEAPVLIADIFPRIDDVISGSPAMIHADAPLVNALELMRQRDVRMLPVVETNGMPSGALILKRLTEHVFIPREGNPIRQVLTSPRSIQKCLQADAVRLFDEDRTEELELYVGAMSPDSFCERFSRVDPRRAVLFVGDRQDIQRHAIRLGIRMLIVTGGLQIHEELIEEAEAQHVSIICSPLDTASSVMSARLSTPVGLIAEQDVPRAHPEDRLDEIRKVLLQSSAPGVLVVDEQGLLKGVATKSNLLKPSPRKLILVDHNEMSQAVAGADQVEILEVIDHHRLGNFHTDMPIRFINQPLGSTCSVVATLYRNAGIIPDASIASLMMAGLLSDTVLLKSPTTTETDRQLLNWLEEISGIDALEFGQRIFKAGSALTGYPDIESLLTADFKEYEVEDRRFGVGQIEVVAFAEFEERYENLVGGLQTLVTKRGLDLACLLVTDIVEQNSQLIVRGDRSMISSVGYPKLDFGRFELKGVLSRKKQLMPHLLRAFKVSGKK